MIFRAKNCFFGPKLCDAKRQTMPNQIRLGENEPRLINLKSYLAK